MKLPRFFVGKNITDTDSDPLKVPPENVLSLRDKGDFKLEINLTHVKDFFVKHRILTESIGVLILVIVIFSIALKGKASIVNFYPETCLGGWENPSNASGQPSVSSEAQGSDFTRDNSAFLKNRTAQLFCGDFGGEVPEDSVPRKFTVRFSWFVDDGSYDKGEKIINKALDEGRVVDKDSEKEKTSSEQNEGGSGVIDNTTTETSDVSDDTSVPSNEGESSDLPKSELPSDTTNTETDSPTPSSEGDSSSDSGKSDDSSSSESSSDGGNSDSGGSDSSGGESSGDSGAGAFLKRFTARVFAQESEEPAPSAEEKEPEVEIKKEEENVEETPVPVDTLIEKENEAPQEEENVQNEDENVDTESEDASSGSDSENTSSSDNENDILTTDDSARDDLFRVTYTIDGSNWEELGVVKRNDWKNIEFEIPFSSVDSWEKLSKVQIAIESLPTIDQFPEAYLDSMWVTVEYEGVNPDPLPQPDFLTDKVLDDIRYENIRVIKVMKPDGQYQIWYAFVPSSLLMAVDGSVGSDEIIKSGDTSLQIIDASTIPEYDPLIGPSPQNTETNEANNTIENSEITPESTLESNEEVLGESIAIVEEIESIDEDVATEEIVNEVQVEEKITETQTEEVVGKKEVTPFESVLEFVTGAGVDEKKSEEKETEKKSDEQNEEVVLNEEIIKEEGDPVDLQELNQPEWYWNLVARGKEVHPEYSIAVDNFKLFWITETGDSINMFGLDSSGTYSGIYFGLQENTGMMLFNTPAGTSRFATFNRDTKQFIFSDE